MNDIELRGVARTIAGRRVVGGVSLAVARGEFFALLGPSGCGKTTLLRMIAGFDAPDEGTILLGGEDVAGVPPHRRDVNLVFQNYALFPHMTVGENVAFGLRMQRARDIPAKVRRALAMVHLPGYEARIPGTLSGGEQQRVALARAIVTGPRVLLLDEPLGALDLKLRKGLQEELRRLHRELGMTFVYVTHDQEEALSMADRVAVMRAGAIEQIGAPREVYERPATRFVAEFVGAGNFLDGDGTRRLLRPERVRIRAESSAGRPAVVVDVLYGGATTRVLLESEGRRLIAEGDYGALRPGARVSVAWDEEDVRVLPE